MKASFFCIGGGLVCAEQKETEELLQGLEDLKQQHKMEALLQSARHTTSLALDEAAGEEPVLQELAEERSRTAGVHVALRKKQAAIAERIEVLRAAPLGVYDLFRQHHSENAPSGRGSAHGRQRNSESVLRDVMNESASVQGVNVLACSGCCHKATPF